jgi:6-pyruvoyltetrahydropterin/6-carboxytetrahydropterin synthase
MHRLTRDVRFSINPFLSEQEQGFNAFASRPTGRGFALFLELTVELYGPVDEHTGFVVNVTEIDGLVRAHAVPLFVKHIQACYGQARHVSLTSLLGVLRAAQDVLAHRFEPACVNALGLKLNPYKKIRIRAEDCTMVFYSEKFEFSATHKLWNDRFSERENHRTFGKCASPSGHGHNYLMEISIKTDTGQALDVVDFERIVSERLISVLDHKNLNVDVAHFSEVIPTMENIAEFAWKRLVDDFDRVRLHCITVWESDRTSCSYFGPAGTPE